MEKLLSIKERLKSINSTISNLENASISLIDKDILLTEIREVYVLISSINSNSNVEEKQAAPQKVVEEIVKQEELVEKPEVLEEILAIPEPEIVEFVDEHIEEPKPEIIPEPVVQESARVEAPKQQNLFANGQTNGNSNVKTIGEQLGQNKTSLNERLAGQSKPKDVSTQIGQKPVSDIKAAIGIGDRFLYIRELFNGNNDDFEQTITHLNSLNSFDDADSYLKKNFSWDDSKETVLNFVSVVRRKYL